MPDVFHSSFTDPPVATAHRIEPHVVDKSCDSAARHTLTLFAFIWAVFTFFHQSKPAFWIRTPLESLQTAAAIFVIFRPSSIPGFLSLVFLQLADLLYTMPNITNHSVFAMFINLTIALAAGVHAISGSAKTLDRGRLLALFAPAVRIQVILLYFWVVFHKINRDFLDIGTSCAVTHTVRLSGLGARLIGWSVFPDGDLARIFVVASTLLIEAAIPILLVWPRTRIAGVGLGLLFHYVLGLNIYHDFSGMLFALYVLFLPANFTACMSDWWDKVRAHFGAYVPASLARGIPAGAWVTTAVICILIATGNTWHMLHKIFYGVWVLYGTLAVLVFAAVVYSHRSEFCYTGREFRTRAVMLIVPLLVLLNGVSPYLGLKTENSFSMFSNLRTEAGVTNHLLIPASLQVFDFQNDLVTISSSSQRNLQIIADHRTAVPFFTLRETVSSLAKRGVKNIEVVYTRAGVERRVTNAELDPELSAPYPWLWRKFLVFREVDLSDQQQCRH